MATAAHRHVRLCHGRRKERRSQRQHEQQQKRDGDESAHRKSDPDLMRDDLNEGGRSIRRKDAELNRASQGGPPTRHAKHKDVPDQRLGCIRRRTAFLPCRVESNPDESIGGSLDRCMMGQLHQDAGACVDPCIIVPNQGHCPGVERALRRNTGDCVSISGGVRPLHLHLTMMSSIAPAADGQICI